MNISLPSISIKRIALFILVWIPGILVVLFSNYLYITRVASFRFVDEYTNMVVGYLLAGGDKLYSDVFFHHHPLPVFVSTMLQHMLHIQSIYELIKFHRYFVMIFSLVGATGLLIKFRTRALFVVVVYEYLKYYLFGYQFLAEALIAYPVAYICLLVLELYQNKRKTSKWEIITSSLVVWWIVFQREPYIPLACFLYVLVVARTVSIKNIMYGMGLLCTLSYLILMKVPFSAYLQQVFALNILYARDELGSRGLQYARGIGYLAGYIWTAIRGQHPLYIILAIVSITALILMAVQWHKKAYAIFAIGISALLLSGIRNIELGSLWYGMYRSIPHTIVLLAITSSLLNVSARKKMIILFIVSMLLIPGSHFFERRNNAEEFYINYSRTDTVAQVILTLCPSKRCSLHINGDDVLVFWQTGLRPWFTYSLFYDVQEAYLNYTSIRKEAFKQSPPDIFYQTECEVRQSFMKMVANDKRYVPLLKDGVPSCIWIKQHIALSIDRSQREQIAHHGYALGE